MHASSGATGELVGVGLGASPGRAVGVVVRSVDEALAAYDRGDAVVFVSVETAPVDEPAMRVACGSGDRAWGSGQPRRGAGPRPGNPRRLWVRGGGRVGRRRADPRRRSQRRGARRPWWSRRRCARPGRAGTRRVACGPGHVADLGGRHRRRAPRGSRQRRPRALGASGPPLRREGRGAVPHRARLPREPGRDPPPGGTWRRRCPRRGRPVAA